MAWNTAAEWAGAMAIAVVATRRLPQPWVRPLRAAGKELILVLSLYAVWRYVRAMTVRTVTGAIEHAQTVWEVQRALSLPSEATLQQWFLQHPLWIQAANGYYALVHVPATIAVLVWLYLRNRGVYRRVRTVLALSTAAALVLHIVPVAPPRMLPQLGFVDTALQYNQSVYGADGSGLSDVYGALPSIHVTWALLVALGTWFAARGRWRWVGPVHLVLTVVAVTVTANHWWMDGIVAAAIVAGAWWAVCATMTACPPPSTSTTRISTWTARSTRSSRSSAAPSPSTGRTCQESPVTGRS